MWWSEVALCTALPPPSPASGWFGCVLWDQTTVGLEADWLCRSRMLTDIPTSAVGSLHETVRTGIFSVLCIWRLKKQLWPTKIKMTQEPGLCLINWSLPGGKRKNKLEKNSVTCSVPLLCNSHNLYLPPWNLVYLLAQATRLVVPLRDRILVQCTESPIMYLIVKCKFH